MEKITSPETTEALTAPEEDIAPPPVGGLTFADGLQFGCGFMVAVTLSLIILALAVLALVLILSLLGVSFL